MIKIEAIPTVYNSVRFRSRLEARWAIYFDEIGLEWIYEPEGYKLSNGVCYLPDFYLPEIKCFVEVKPDRQLTVREIDKIVYLVDDTKIGCLILKGYPSVKPYQLIDVSSFDQEESEIIFDNWVAVSCYKDYPKEEGRFFSNPTPYDFEGQIKLLIDHNAIDKARKYNFSTGKISNNDIMTVKIPDVNVSAKLTEQQKVMRIAYRKKLLEQIKNKKHISKR